LQAWDWLWQLPQNEPLTAVKPVLATPVLVKPVEATQEAMAVWVATPQLGQALHWPIWHA
jgi:hypothetical protein